MPPDDEPIHAHPASIAWANVNPNCSFQVAMAYDGNTKYRSEQVSFELRHAESHRGASTGRQIRVATGAQSRQEVDRFRLLPTTTEGRVIPPVPRADPVCPFPRQSGRSTPSSGSV